MLLIYVRSAYSGPCPTFPASSLSCFSLGSLITPVCTKLFECARFFPFWVLCSCCLRCLMLFPHLHLADSRSFRFQPESLLPKQIFSTISFFKLKYIWYITLCKFKVYMLIIYCNMISIITIVSPSRTSHNYHFCDYSPPFLYHVSCSFPL